MGNKAQHRSEEIVKLVFSSAGFLHLQTVNSKRGEEREEKCWARSQVSQSVGSFLNIRQLVISAVSIFEGHNKSYSSLSFRAGGAEFLLFFILA